MEKKLLAGHLLALLTVSIWGTTFISTKILLHEFYPVEILFFRFILALLVLTVVLPRKLKIENKRHELLFMAAGLCGVTMYYLLENIALTLTLAANVGVISALAPLFTAVTAFLFLREERLRLNFFIGFAVAMAGVFFISFRGTADVEIHPAGDMLALAGTVVWAAYSVLMRIISRFGYPTLLVTRKIFFYGILFMIPALFFFEFELGLERFLELENIFHLCFLGLGASALCFATWNHAVKVLGAVKTSAYIYLVPVITVAASAVFLGEKITPLAALGTVLTLGGLLISEGRIFIRSKETGQ